MPELWRFPLKPLYTRALNAVGFQVGWFACVLGGDIVALAVTPILLLLHHWSVRPRIAEWWLIVLAGVSGLCIDSALAVAGVLQFSSPTLGPITVWLLCLWLLFGATLNHSLGWLRDRLLLAACLGGVAGPVSYFAGTKLAPVALSPPVSHSLLWLALVWAAVFPCLLIVSRRKL